MFYGMIKLKSDQWFALNDCTVRAQVKYISKAKQMRDAQVDAIRPLFLKVACVGGSITYGCFMSWQPWNSYPRQLRRMLGRGYCVGKFGYTNRTALKRLNRYSAVRRPESLLWRGRKPQGFLRLSSHGQELLGDNGIKESEIYVDIYS